MADQETKIPEGSEAVQVEATEIKPEPTDQMDVTTTTATDTALPSDKKPDTAAEVKVEENAEEKADEKDEKPATTTEDNKGKKHRTISNPPPGMLKIKRPEPRDFKLPKSNENKFDPLALGETDNPDLIRTQVSNLVENKLPYTRLTLLWYLGSILPQQFQPAAG